MKKRIIRGVRAQRPNWQLKALSQAIALAGAGLQAGAAIAAVCPATVTTVQTTGCMLPGGQSVTVSATGVIRTSDPVAINITGVGATTITNSGEIDGFAIGVGTFGSIGAINIANNAGGTIEGGVGIFVSGGNSLTLTNSGSISGSSTFGADGILFLGDFNGSITNTSTGTISAVAGGASSERGSAAGIYVIGDLNGTVNNSGTISGVAGGSVTSGSAYGIYVSGALNGSITNTSTGIISGTADVGSSGSSESAYAAGIYVNSGITATGSITNNGTITADATVASSNGQASATGIYVGSGSTGEGGTFSLAGTLTNSGTITATATAAGDGAFAAGVFIDGDMVGATFNNASTGHITATATGTSASAYGIFIDATIDADSTLTNAGTITVTANATGSSFASASAYGIFIDDDLDGTLINSGTIDVTATASSEVDAYGIYVSSTIGATGTLTNSGHITVAATADSVYHAAGIYVSENLEGSILNSGTITVTANGTSSASAAGIYVSSTITASGTLTNSGTITVTAVATSGTATAAGIFVSEDLEGSIVNSGTITANASNTDEGFALAAGIYVSSTMDNGSSLTNSGTINVTADGGSSSVAVGIFVSELLSGATVTNSGTINVTANSVGGGSSEAGASSLGAVGIAVGFLQVGATLTNSGTVTANTDAGPGTGWAMFVNFGGSSEVGFPLAINSGVMNGNVFLRGTSLTNTGTLSIPTSTGANGTFSFVGRDYTQSGNGVFQVAAFSTAVYGRMEVAGTADITASGHFGVRVMPNDQLVAGGILQNVLHADTLVDNPNNFSVTDDSPFWNFTAVDDGEHGIDLLIQGNTVPVLASQSVQAANMDIDQLGGIVMGRMETVRLMTEIGGSHDQNLWLRPYGTKGSQDEDNDIDGYDIESYGGVIGYDTRMGDSQWHAGAALAAAKVKVEADSSDDKVDANDYQVSLYGYWNGPDHMAIDLMAIVGSSNNDSRRPIGGGAVVAEGNYDGYFMRLTSAVSKGFPLNEQLTVTPSVIVSYTYVHEDSYTESGAGGANLDVSGNNARSLIVGVDGQLAYVAGSMLLTTHIGGGYDTLTDDAAVTSQFVGGGAPFNTPGNEPSEWLGRAGVGAEMAVGDSIEVHLNYEYEYRDTFQNNLLMGTLRWKI